MNFKDPTGFLSGTVRPLVTVMLVSAAVVATFSGLIAGDKLFDLTMMATAFWFGSRPTNPPPANNGGN